MWPETSLHLLLDTCAVQDSTSGISLLQGLSPSEEGPCGGPWGWASVPLSSCPSWGIKLGYMAVEGSKLRVTLGNDDGP